MTPNSPNEPDVMTAQEVSDFLKIPLSTLYGLAKQGRIKGVKVGKHWRYLRHDILDYLHGKTNPDPDSNERRFYPRINCEIPTEFHIRLSRRQISAQGVIFTLSEYGAYFQDGPISFQVQVDDPVEVTFEVGDRKIFAQGRIIHFAAGVGIKFKGLSAADREAIRDYIG